MIDNAVAMGGIFDNHTPESDTTSADRWSVQVGTMWVNDAVGNAWTWAVPVWATELMYEVIDN